MTVNCYHLHIKDDTSVAYAFSLELKWPITWLMGEPFLGCIIAIRNVEDLQRVGD